MIKKQKYYAYKLASGSEGICENWKDCEKIVSGKEARFRGFASLGEAKNWLNAGARYESKVKGQMSNVDLIPGIYFDAGTGRGNGVEISVTDEKGENLLYKVMPKSKINKFGKHHLGKNFTNNYGELLACKYALIFAIKNSRRSSLKSEQSAVVRAVRVFGDSKLVIDYWSRGFIKRNALPVATVKLADKVAKLRKEFESLGGEVGRISGDDNPADLGFH